jgi:hypothetical protein
MISWPDYGVWKESRGCLINWKKNAKSASISYEGEVLFSGVKTAGHLDALN